jgi:ribosomal protein S18 acetylase RimI-like enzyme
MNDESVLEVLFRNALEGEAEVLSAVAFRSKAHWGYSPEFMEACRDELTYSSGEILAQDSTYIVADAAGSIAGFIALVKLDGESAELDGLFVDPEYIGHGIGKELMRQAVTTARQLMLKKIVIQVDPNAARFYESVGASVCGERESSSIPGRMLPLYEIYV